MPKADKEQKAKARKLALIGRRAGSDARDPAMDEREVNAQRFRSLSPLVMFPITDPKTGERISRPYAWGESGSSGHERHLKVTVTSNEDVAKGQKSKKVNKKAAIAKAMAKAVAPAQAAPTDAPAPETTATEAAPPPAPEVKAPQAKTGRPVPRRPRKKHRSQVARPNYARPAIPRFTTLACIKVDVQATLPNPATPNPDHPKRDRAQGQAEWLKAKLLAAIAAGELLPRSHRTRMVAQYAAHLYGKLYGPARLGPNYWIGTTMQVFEEWMDLVDRLNLAAKKAATEAVKKAAAETALPASDAPKDAAPEAPVVPETAVN